MEISTERLAPGDAGFDRAASILRAGGRVAFPTETVYGLGADARDDRAVASIFAAKDRPSFNPLIVHVENVEAAGRFAELGPLALRLAETFWPGSLTLVLPLAPNSSISQLATAGLETVAIRVPASPVAHALLARFGGPVAAPSANPSGRVSPTTADHVLAGLDGRIEAILDGGACPVGIESTIVDLTDRARLLRHGGVASEAIESVLGTPLLPPPPSEDARPSAPGQLSSHYAPRATVRLNATEADADEVFLGFGPGLDSAQNLSAAGDLTEAAANLFAALHRLDQSNVKRIAVAPIPETGLGAAINDRLRRAAAPRG